MADKMNWVEEMTIRNEERITSAEKLLQTEVASLHRAVDSSKSALQLQMAIMALLAALAQAGITWGPVIAAVRSAAAK